MAEFQKIVVQSLVPSYAKEEGTIISQNNDILVFKTKKKRSSRALTRHIALDHIISTQTNKEGITTLIYLEPQSVIEHKNVDSDKFTSSNYAGFVNIKTGGGVLSLNKKFLNAFTETSSGEVKLEKKGSKEKTSEKKKDKNGKENKKKK
jgi:hypothetical protein